MSARPPFSLAHCQPPLRRRHAVVEHGCDERLWHHQDNASACGETPRGRSVGGSPYPHSPSTKAPQATGRRWLCAPRAWRGCPPRRASHPRGSGHPSKSLVRKSPPCAPCCFMWYEEWIFRKDLPGFVRDRAHDLAVHGREPRLARDDRARHLPSQLTVIVDDQVDVCRKGDVPQSTWGALSRSSERNSNRQQTAST